MPIKEAISAIKNAPSRAVAPIGRKVEKASRTTRHRLTRAIVRRRWRWAYVLASTWAWWVLIAFLIWFALTSESPNVTRWLYKTKLWLAVALPVLNLVYARWNLHRRWELFEARRKRRMR